MTLCNNAPLGLLPYGYHIVDFAERYVNAGAEASVTFIGPSTTRFDFLGEIFGYWMAATDPVTNECCACLNAPPCPYPYILNASEDEHEEGEYFCDNGVDTDCLWPDTFTIQRESNTAQVLKLNCTTPEDVAECSKPLYFGSLDADGNPCECFCEIQVNYRHKNHASWPRFFQPCEKQGLWLLPTIPQGTFIDVRIDGFTSARLVKGTSLTYTNDSYFHTNPAYRPGSLCERNPDAPSTSNAFSWCDPEPTGTSLSPQEELFPSRLIQTTNLEITWSNVPLYDKRVLDSLVGCVNDMVWLGYPAESVLFLSADPVIRGTWGCNEVYDIVLKFAIQTVPISCLSVEDADPILDSAYFSETELASVGVYNGQLGLWNRMWSDTAIHLEYTEGNPPTTKKVCCTNWVPVEFNREACCDDDSSGYGKNMKIYERACFHDIFTFNECLHCYDDCPETWPDCAFGSA